VQPKVETKPVDKATAQPPAAPKPPVAPDVFKVKFECSNGEFVVECRREWAPRGTDRFYELVQQGFFNECRFFRALKGFVVQFGVSGDPAVSMKWLDRNIKDEPRKQSNTEGTITFAKSNLPNSRTTQVFINLVDNTRLDGDGFAPFGKVISGMDTVKKINMEYGNNPDQDRIQQQGNAYLQKSFPNLDYIKKASIVTEAAS
jgi:peptidyl-prolyl cis-trans isomerase A (cyclophilin A)